MRSLTLVSALLLLTALAACGGEGPAEEALDAAEDKVEEASDAIDDMQQDTRTLRLEAASLRQDLDASVRKQAELWSRELEVYRERLERLPAAAERRLAPELKQLEGEVTALQARLEDYSSAAAETAPRLKEEIDGALSDLQASFDSFEESLESSEKG